MANPPTNAAPRRRIESVADVDLLVRRFYQAVIPDPLLGPIFHAVGVDWSEHIPKLVDFWAGRLLGIPGYTGNAVGAHQPVLDRCPFGQAELRRWLELWEETVDELFSQVARPPGRGGDRRARPPPRRPRRAPRRTGRPEALTRPGPGGP